MKLALALAALALFAPLAHADSSYAVSGSAVYGPETINFSFDIDVTMPDLGYYTANLANVQLSSSGPFTITSYGGDPIGDGGPIFEDGWIAFFDSAGDEFDINEYFVGTIPQFVSADVFGCQSQACAADYGKLGIDIFDYGTLNSQVTAITTPEPGVWLMTLASVGLLIAVNRRGRPDRFSI